MNPTLRKAVMEVAQHDTIAQYIPLVMKSADEGAIASRGSVKAEKEQSWTWELMRRIGVRFYNLLDEAREEEDVRSDLGV